SVAFMSRKMRREGRLATRARISLAEKRRLSRRGRFSWTRQKSERRRLPAARLFRLRHGAGLDEDEALGLDVLLDGGVDLLGRERGRALGQLVGPGDAVAAPADPRHHVRLRADQALAFLRAVQKTLRREPASLPVAGASDGAGGAFRLR